MNQLATRMQEHWKLFQPTRYSQIQNPREFFTNLAREAEEQVAETFPGIAGDDLPGETYEQKIGRLNAAKNQAQEIVERDPYFFPTAEPGSPMDETDPESPTPDRGEDEPEMTTDWIPTTADPTHPFYQNRLDL